MCTMAAPRRRPLGQRRSNTKSIMVPIVVTTIVACLRMSAIEAALDSAFQFTPSSDVSNYLNLALDVRDMRMETTILKKREIYENGRSSSGATSPPQQITLQSLSLNASSLWPDVPMYNVYMADFFRLGVEHEQDDQGMFDGRPVEQYADTLVEDLFELQSNRDEGTAAVVFNVLMTYWGQLWRILTTCQAQDAKGAQAAIDAALALWVGEGQVRNNAKGHLLYALAEYAGSKFGQDSGEATVNTQTITLLRTLQEKVKRGECSTPDQTYVGMRKDVQTLVQQSNIMLSQTLLHYIQDVVDNNANSDIVELLALAIAPQIAACDTSLYKNVTDLVVTHDVTVRTYKTAIAQLQKSFSCLGITCAQVGAYLGGLIPTCRDPKIDPTAPLPRLAKYQPVNDVRSLSVLDRDIRHIGILVQFEAWHAAYDYFRYGWNSNECSLADIANGIPIWTDSTDFDAYSIYYDDDEAAVYGYGVDLASNALQGIEAFKDVSVAERQGVILGTLQSYVMYLGVVGQITASLKACTDANKQQAGMNWDSAVALFIGSAEGEMPGGQGGGQSLYAASKTFCRAFGTCESSNSTIVNTVLMASLEAGAKEVQAGVCAVAQTIFDEKIRPFLLTTMIQGVLYYATEASQNPKAMNAKGYLIAYTLALLPHVKNKESANELKFIIRPNSEIDVPATFKAIRDCLDDMGVKCAEVGRIAINDDTPIGVCGTDTVPDIPVTRATGAPTKAPVAAPIFVGTAHDDGLAWGRYNFSFPDVANNDSLFSLDVKSMWFSDTATVAQSVYLSPSTHAIKGLSRQANVSSLQSLNTKASLFMMDDPMYNFYRLALFDDESFENKSGTDGGWPYADAVVELALGPKNGHSAQLGSKAAVVLNLWMAIAHKLYQAVRTCSGGGGSDATAVEFIDSAVGLWIGQEQGDGKFNSGWSMYSIAQEAAQLYGNKEEETRVNSLLMDLFVQAQDLAHTCSVAGTSDALRTHIDEVVRVLSIPLLQHLLFHMSDNNFEYVELYALAFIPQTISVDEGAFEYLRDSLFEGFNWEATVTTDFLSALSKVLYAMRFSCDDLGDSTTAGEALRGLVDVICEEFKFTFNTTFLAAYETSFDVSELARLDLDVLQMDLFMRANAKELALTVYTKGRNSLAPDGGFNTLQDIATRLPDGAAGDLQRLQRGYFLDDGAGWADDIVLAALNTTEFDVYSRRQQSENVRRTLQNMVVYVETISLAKAAIDKCNAASASDLENAGQEEIDQAVALYVGSIEGPFSGGNPYGLVGSGQMMYAMAKEMCRPLASCESHGDSDANVFLLFAFSQMKEGLDDGDCESAESTLEESLLTVLPVPLIQGILFYADLNDRAAAGSKNASLVAGAIFAETLLPELDKVNKTQAAIIYGNMDYDPVQITVRDGKKAVFDAVASLLDSFGVDCDAVGTLVSSNLTFCTDADATVAPPANTSTTLLDGVYVTTTYVEDKANIALDIKEMREALNLNHSRMAETIYEDGRNSDIFDKNGKEIDLRTLSGFSTKAAVTMKSNPVFQVAVYALRDVRGNYLGNHATMFGDSVVQEMLLASSATKAPLAAEAAVALNLWMELTNELFMAVAECKNNRFTDTEGIRAIDGAVAYWIGDSTTGDDSATGHLLYALAEEMGSHFSINATGHSRTNSNILRLFQEAKVELSLPNACTASNPTTPRKLRRIVDKIISLMVVVNIQALIHFLLQDREQFRVRIYAHAFVPLVAGCSPSTFTFLKEKLLDSEFREADVQSILVAIRSTFPCFGIKCDDVGTHSGETSTACTDPSPQIALAGYTPASDVRDYALMDVETLELDILMQMRAFEAAEELYSLGKRSSLGNIGGGASLSLEYLATTTSRSVVPQFEEYQKHFDNDVKYADTLIRKAFANSTAMTDVQRRVVATGTSEYMIMYMAALQAMHEAIGSCKTSNSDKNNAMAKTWDKVAAYLIGHLEGPKEGGSSDGRLLWGLGKKHCAEFKACSGEGGTSSRINDKISTLFYAGRGALVGGSCDELRKATTSLTPLLLVPLLQALLSATARLARRSQTEKEMLQAEAYIYAQTLLPLIENVNHDTAKKIRNNFPLDGQPISDGVAAVASAFSSVMPGLGVDCTDVGVSDEIDACTGRVTRTRRTMLMISVGVILGLVTVFGIVVLLRTKRRTKKQKDDPVFIKSNGELNHTSELLCARTDETTSPRDSDEETDRLNDACDALENDPQNDDDEYVRAIENALISDNKQIV